MEQEKRRIVKVDVSGKDEVLFARIREKLLEGIDNFINTTIDYKTGSSIGEETKELTSLALGFAKEKLKKAGIENHKLIAEIEEKYSVAQKNKAEARKTYAETRKIEFDQRIRELSLTLKLSKALTIGKNGEEAVIFTKQIEAFMEAIEEINNQNLI